MNRIEDSRSVIGYKGGNPVSVKSINYSRLQIVQPVDQKFHWLDCSSHGMD